MANLFNIDHNALETPAEVYRYSGKESGAMLAYLKMALRELPEDNFCRQWIVKDINENIAKM